jgi:acetylornithine deacetylase/succinyl-diaminopimelate desuccinylase-like protein
LIPGGVRLLQVPKAWRLLAIAVAACTGSASHAAAPETVRTQAREILQELIGFRTSEGLGQVPAMVDYLTAKLRAGGFAAEDITVLPSGETAALLVRYRGNGHGGRPILLLAHMDVVTARAEDWQRDPFTLVEENGYFFGRGTVDIKSEIAVLVATFLRLKAEGFVPSRDLVLAFSGDEESRMTTTRELAAKAREMFDPEFALNADGGEGTLDEQSGAPLVYYLQGAEKSYATFEITVRSPGGHSSEPRPDNAIYGLGGVLEALRAYRFPVMWNDWTIGSFKAAAAATPGELGEAMGRFAANPRDEAAADVLARYPAVVGRTRTTCVATMLSAGHAENALPQSATVTVNCRIFPGTPIAEVRSALARVAGDEAEVRLVGTPIVSEASPMRDDVVDAVTRAVHAVHPGVPIVPDMAAYVTDGSILRAAGIPTYGTSSIFIKDSDDFSHGQNERLPVASFYDGLEHWHTLIHALAL